MSTSDRDALQEQGRQVRLIPLAPGVWTVLLGSGTMALGPLFGFLCGSMLGTDRVVWGMSPIYFFLFLGFMVAGLGLGAVLLGGRRLLLDYRTAQTAQKTQRGTAAPAPQVTG